MFKYVRNTGRVLRRRSKRDTKHFVFIIINQWYELHTGFPVSKYPRASIEIRDIFIANEFKSVLIFHKLSRCREGLMFNGRNSEDLGRVYFGDLSDAIR